MMLTLIKNTFSNLQIYSMLLFLILKNGKLRCEANLERLLLGGGVLGQSCHLVSCLLLVSKEKKESWNS